MAGRIILDLCGGTGAWSEPYSRAGYDVRLITLPAFDVRAYIPPDNVHGILAAPPCTEFSCAKGSRPRDFAGALDVIAGCLRVIWHARAMETLVWWCLENPRGLLRQFLGVPRYSIEYWQYGDALHKPTDLWGYFKLPSASVFKRPADLPKIREFWNWDGRKAERAATTPPGFSNAFFKANP